MKDSKDLHLDIVWPRIIGIADEIAATVIRTAFSFDVIELHDLSTAVFDAKGRMLAVSAVSSPGHFNGMIPLMEIILRRFGKNDIRPGDVFVANDPWVTSAHTPDVFMITPVFRGDQLIAFVVSLVHQVDIGGRAGSGLAEVAYEEGLIIPPLKLYKEGKPNQDLFQLFERNVRFSDKVIGDLRAQVAAGIVGAKRIVELVEDYKLDSLEEVADEIVARTEASMRAGIAALPDGVYRSEVPVELLNDKNEPLRICLTATVKGDTFHVDFTGSSPQVRRPVNAAFLTVRSYVVSCLKMVVDPHTPLNSGTYLPVSMHSPEGTIVNAKFPAPTIWRFVPLHMTAEAMVRILAEIAPDRTLASSGSMPAWMFYTSGLRKSGAPFMLHFMAFGGMGGRPGRDGLASVSFPYRSRDVCTEDTEIETPFLVEKREIICDGGGPGQWRGGSGEEVVVRMAAPGGDIDPTQLITIAGAIGHLGYPAPGIFGGKSGPLGQILVNGQPTDVWKRSGSIELRLSASDTLTFSLPGGGGYGDPGERAPELVAQDLKNGYISEESAVRDYGYNPDT